MTYATEWRRILFLDIDGVLNAGDADYDPVAKSNRLRPSCVAALNRVIDRTDCGIVVMSAWRYMVLNGAMTLDGFSYLLRTHHLHVAGRLIGTTIRDEQTEDPDDRASQVQEWLDANGAVEQWAAVDNLDLGSLGPRFVRTDGDVGLTVPQSARLTSILLGLG